MLAHSYTQCYSPPMAWKFKRPESNHWWIGYRLNGKQYRRSVGTSDETKADAELAKLDIIRRAHDAGRLTDEFYRLLTKPKGGMFSLRKYADQWLSECKDLAEYTQERYKDLLGQLCRYLQATDDAPLLRDVTREEIAGFLRHKRAQTSLGTTKLSRRVLVNFFNYAVDNQAIPFSPVPSGKSLKLVQGKGQRAQRRSFTLDEIKLIYTQAPSDFWRYMIMMGFYTGQRLGDLVCLPWCALDFDTNTIRMTAHKTGRPLAIPMRSALRTLLWKHRQDAGQNVKTANPIWPDEAQKYAEQGANPFSAEFYNEVLLKAGLVASRTHKAKKSGRNFRRQASPVSFHCLRHTFVSLLKISGGSQAVAKELAGHSSDAVSDLYTHIPESALREALEKLPEVTK